MIGPHQRPPFSQSSPVAARERGERISGLPDRPERLATIVPVASAAAAGAGLGVFSSGSALGFLVGAALGGGLGALFTRLARDRDRKTTERDSLLDREIGVTEGDLGAAQYREEQPSSGGGYSAASAGASYTSRGLSGGPIPR